MWDNMLFIFFRPPHSPTGSSSMLWIQIQEHTLCCKDIGFSEAPVPFEIYYWQNLGFYWLLAQGKWFEEMVSNSLPTCTILHGMQVRNITLVQMVYYSLTVCVSHSSQYCQWVNSSVSASYWKCWTGSGVSHSLKWSVLRFVCCINDALAIACG